MLVTENINYKGSCIYCIWSPEDGLMYFGQTVQYRHRALAHLRELSFGRHANAGLQRVFDKSSELHIAPVEFCGKESLDSRERFWISFYKTDQSEFGYNLTSGGIAGFKKDKETIYKQANSRRGKSGSLLGRPQSEAHKKARSLATKGISKPMTEKALEAVKAAQRLRRGSTKSGTTVNVVNLNTGFFGSFESIRAAEDNLNLRRGTISDSFDKRRVKNENRRNPKIMVYKNFFIEKAA